MRLIKEVRKGKVYQNENNVIRLETEQKEFDIIVISDAHLDNPKTNKKWLHSQLDKYKDAYIIIDGDSIDMMQAKGDPRSDKDSLAPELKTKSYVNKVVRMLRDLEKKYRDRLIGINRGNHDNEYWRRHDIDILDIALGDKIPIGDFCGYYVIVSNKYGKVNSNVIYYQHAPYSGGKRSKGMLSVDILKGQRHGVDIFLTGHIHDNYHTLQASWDFNVRNNREIKKKQWFIQQTTLKQEDEDRNGFHAERIKAGAGIQGFNILSFKVATSNGTIKMEMTPQLISI